MAGFLALVTAGAPLGIARAQANKAAAESLLGEGLDAMEAGKLAVACPKLEESLRLYPSLNTGYYLGDCWERSGRIASAWIQFLEVAEKAHAANEPGKEKKARERASALSPKVSRLTIAVTTPADGMVVKRDDELVGNGQWGSAVPIDPGEHRVEAGAPGKKTWSTKIVVAKDGATATLTVPALVDDEVAKKPGAKLTPVADPGTPRVDGEEPSRNTWQRPAAYVAGGIGLLGIGLGVVFGLSAKSKWKDAEPHCPNNVCDEAGYASWDSARSTARLSTFAFIGGGVALAAGTILSFTAPSGNETRVSFSADPTSCRLIAAARF